jgi:hypothetical protein
MRGERPSLASYPRRVVGHVKTPRSAGQPRTAVHRSNANVETAGGALTARDAGWRRAARSRVAISGTRVALAPIARVSTQPIGRRPVSGLAGLDRPPSRPTWTVASMDDPHRPTVAGAAAACRSLCASRSPHSRFTRRDEAAPSTHNKDSISEMAGPHAGPLDERRSSTAPRRDLLRSSAGAAEARPPRGAQNSEPKCAGLAALDIRVNCEHRDKTIVTLSSLS